MLRWLGLAARLVVGGVWLWAGLLKLSSPESSVTAVRAYQLLPLGMTEVVGRALPIVEVILGSLLVLGLLTRIAGVLSGLLFVAFIVGIASVWIRGIPINCGCFGGGGYDPKAFDKYPWEIARDSALLLASLLLVWRPRTPLAVDNVIFPDSPEPVLDEPAKAESTTRK